MIAAGSAEDNIVIRGGRNVRWRAACRNAATVDIVARGAAVDDVIAAASDKHISAGLTERNVDVRRLNKLATVGRRSRHVQGDVRSIAALQRQTIKVVR